MMGIYPVRSARSSVFFCLCVCLLIVQELDARGPVGDGHSLFTSPTRYKRKASPEAYVTLLYGDEFSLGVRVLGKSIRDTGTTKDMVALVSDGVSERAVKLLEADGWIIQRIELLANPNTRRPKRFWGVYTKLKIFNLTNYTKVVYLDADTVVMKSIEDLFLCQKFCANLKHSERLNSGVMVVEPSLELFEDMMDKVNTLPSYTGGDQGFLNSYYPDFPNARLFDPSLSEEDRKKKPPPSMERLSTLYNADVGLYMLANKWMVNETELRVVHYTLGPLKPWDWWTVWLLDPVRYWQDVRVTLEESLPGTRAGLDPRTQFYVWTLIIIPLIFSLFFCRGCLCKLYLVFTRHTAYKHRRMNNLPYYSVINGLQPPTALQYTSGTLSSLSTSKVPVYLGVLSVVVCFLVAGVSFGITMFLIPRQILPVTGLFLFYLWTFFLFAMMYGWYLRTVSMWGRTSLLGTSIPASLTLPYEDAKGYAKQLLPLDGETLLYAVGAVCLAILAPCIPFLCGVTALFARISMSIGGGMVLVAFMTRASQHVATRCYVRGLEVTRHA